jgi:hypothetical protein
MGVVNALKRVIKAHPLTSNVRIVKKKAEATVVIAGLRHECVTL